MSNRLFAVLLLAVFSVFHASLILATRPAQPPEKQESWQYTTARLRVDSSLSSTREVARQRIKSKEELDELTRDGWEPFFVTLDNDEFFQATIIHLRRKR